MVKGFWNLKLWIGNSWNYVVRSSGFFLCWQIFYFYIFFSRSLRRMSPFNWTGVMVFMLRLCLLPAFYFLLWIFYYHGFEEGSDVSINTFQYNIYDTYNMKCVYSFVNNQFSNYKSWIFTKLLTKKNKRTKI